MEKFRQLHAFSREADDQLFGYASEHEIRIAVATGLYKKDQRRRYQYHFDDNSAQKIIETFAKDGLYYLGEWHTHAEDFPTASASYVDAMNKLLDHSKLNIKWAFAADSRLW